MPRQVVAFNAAPKGSPTKTLDYLYETALRVVRRRQQEANMTEIVGSTSNRAASAQPKGEDVGTEQHCISFAKSGKCRFGDLCRYEHVQKAGRRGKSAQCSADLGGKKTDKTERNECILFVRNGSCPFGGRCKYSHPTTPSAAGRSSGMFSIAMTAKDKKQVSDRWIIDIGASMHLCGSTTVGEQIALAEPVVLETANGQVKIQRGIRTNTAGIGKNLVCAEMPCDVQSLSLGKLCAEDGFSLAWRPLEAPGPPRPLGEYAACTVENFVPLLTEHMSRGRGMALPSAEVASPDGGPAAETAASGNGAVPEEEVVRRVDVDRSRAGAGFLGEGHRCEMPFG